MLSSQAPYFGLTETPKPGAYSGLTSGNYTYAVIPDLIRDLVIC